MLEVSGLTKTYGRSRGIRGISFSVEPGTIFGLVGAKGAGKTTCLRCIMDFLSRNEGQVKLAGREFDRHTPRAKVQIGYLPEDASLLPGMTVRSALSFYSRFYRNISEGKLGPLIRGMQIDLRSKVSSLTPEEVRRVELVLALMHKPRLLLLDEPGKGQSPMMQEVIHRLLLEEKERGAAVVLTTESLAEAAAVCDSAALMKDGQILIMDEMKSIVRGAVYQITLTCADPGIARRLGGKAIEQEGDRVRFLYEGEPATLVEELHQTQLSYLLVEEPRLEDIFDHFYQ